MAILDSLRKFIFCFKFMKSDKREIIKYQYENIFFILWREFSSCKSWILD